MEFFIYLGKVSLYWIVLYGCYWILLGRHTFFGWNRAYLLGALLLSLGLPMVQYPEAAPVMPTVAYAAATLPVAVSAPPAFVVYSQSEEVMLSWPVLLWVVYTVGAMLLLVRLGLQFRTLFSFLQKGERIPMDGYMLVLLDDDRTGSFSFMKWIVINRTDYAENLDTILNHELVHVQQRHSWDILLVEVLRVVFWFNPVLILYKKSLQQIHEYLADRETAISRDGYARFLMEYAFHTSVPDLTNQFFTSSFVKNRITMLYKNKNSKWALGKYLAIVPLVGLVLMLTAARERVTDALGNNTRVLPSATSSRAPLPEVPLAETTTVKGTVRSSKTKELLPGANVIVAGTSRGATTDANGAFELKEVPLDSKLAISYVGYETRVVEITKKNQAVNVVLAWQQNPLQDVVVVAYPPITGLKPQPGADNTPSSPAKDGFTIVEQMPEFPGGIQEMYKFLGRNIKYPTDAVRNDVEGKVVIAFTVSEKGRIRDPQVTQRLGDGTDEEALRVVLNMPSWKPAQQNGRPVAMEYVLPIEFKLEKPESKEDKEKRQGNATKYFNYQMPEFKFENAFDSGSPASIRDLGAPEVNIPGMGGTSRMRFSNYSPYSSQKVFSDVTPPTMIIFPASRFKKD
ncbi:TonB family protein [Salmonirosea aquatica]|uniref:TonB family protein n=1 Tax=Salmonirosea aquatica TaxID=2654236 RepID=A0A7C9F336_9BACT|nr:TonB family protein [Cytophagaceae bacterium SJW1-29]